LESPLRVNVQNGDDAISSYFDVVAGLFGKDSNEAIELRRVGSKMHKPKVIAVSHRQPPHGRIDFLEVSKNYLETTLMEHLLLLVVRWLRAKGLGEIRTRCHIGYRGEDRLLQKVGFDVESSSTIWRRRTSS